MSFGGFVLDLLDRVVSSIIDESICLEAVLEDADGVFGIHPIREDGEVSKRLLPLVWLPLGVWKVIAAGSAERLSNQS